MIFYQRARGQVRKWVIQILEKGFQTTELASSNAVCVAR